MYQGTQGTPGGNIVECQFLSCSLFVTPCHTVSHPCDAAPAMPGFSVTCLSFSPVPLDLLYPFWEYPKALRYILCILDNLKYIVPIDTHTQGYVEPILLLLFILFMWPVVTFCYAMSRFVTPSHKRALLAQHCIILLRYIKCTLDSVCNIQHWLVYCIFWPIKQLYYYTTILQINTTVITTPSLFARACHVRITWRARDVRTLFLALWWFTTRNIANSR